MDMNMQVSTPGSDTSAAHGQEKKGPWSPEEDHRLRDAVGTDAPRPKWAEIANLVEGRSAKQCRERWEQNLSPRLNKHPITASEGVFIIQFVDAQGKKWAEIARQLTNRSDNNIKNWYNGMVQKGKTGRGPQDEELRRHFSPDHQGWLNSNGRRPMHQRATPMTDSRQHVHSYQPYMTQRPVSYSAPLASPFSATYTPASEPTAVGHDYAPMPASHRHHHHQSLLNPLFDRGAGGVSLPPISTQLPEARVQLAPLRTPAACGPASPGLASSPYMQVAHSHMQQHGIQSREPHGEMRDYFEHVNLSRSNYQRRVSAVSPMSRTSEDSRDTPSISGSSSSTPLNGSPLTPVLHERDSYRRSHYPHEVRRVGSEREIMRHDVAKESSDQENKMSIDSVLN